LGLDVIGVDRRHEVHRCHIQKGFYIWRVRILLVGPHLRAVFTALLEHLDRLLIALCRPLDELIVFFKFLLVLRRRRQPPLPRHLLAL